MTGIAGPSGGTPAKPVGTVAIAVVAPDQPARVRTFTFAGGRAQVKFQARPIGRPSLQQFYGAAILQQKPALFFSSSGYTTQALEFADAAGMALFEFNVSGEVHPVNGKAEALARAADGLGPPLSESTKHLNGIIAGIFGLLTGLAIVVFAFPQPRPRNPADCQPLISVYRDCPSLWEEVGQVAFLVFFAVVAGSVVWLLLWSTLNRLAQHRLDRKHGKAVSL